MTNPLTEASRKALARTLSTVLGCPVQTAHNAITTGAANLNEDQQYTAQLLIDAHLRGKRLADATAVCLDTLDDTGSTRLRIIEQTPERTIHTLPLDISTTGGPMATAKRLLHLAPVDGCRIAACGQIEFRGGLCLLHDLNLEANGTTASTPEQIARSAASHASQTTLIRYQKYRRDQGLPPIKVMSWWAEIGWRIRRLSRHGHDGDTLYATLIAWHQQSAKEVAEGRQPLAPDRVLDFISANQTASNASP